MKTKPEREDLGRFYKDRFDHFKRTRSEFDPLTTEAHMNVIRTGDLLYGAVDRRMRQKGLTCSAWGVLVLLESAPGRRLSMKEIGNLLLVSKANVTGLVDTLEGRGLVNRVQNPSDRRVITIQISEAGIRKMDDVYPWHMKFVNSLYSGLKAAERKTLIKALQGVRVALLKHAVLALGLAVGLATAAFADLSTAPLTLETCYIQALAQTESLKERAERIVQFNEQVRQTFGAIYPTVQFNASEFLQDDGGRSGVFSERERPEVKISARQPLYAGFRELHAGKALKALGRREDLLLAQARRALYVDVAQAFYLAVQHETDLANVRSILRLTEDRVRELREREDLGKSRPSEILSAESQRAALKSQEAQIEGDLAAARETLSLLTGLDCSVRVLADHAVPGEPSLSETAFLDKAAQRLELRAAQEAVQAEKLKLKVARGTLLPTADATGNYYLKRTGFQEPIDWDVTLALKIPLFEGGRTRAEIREALSRVRESEWVRQRTARAVRSEIRRAHLLWTAAQNQIRTQAEAVAKAGESYKIQSKEYRLGLVNNLEVLQALNILQEAQRNFDRAQVRGKLAWIQLKASVEELP